MPQLMAKKLNMNIRNHSRKFIDFQAIWELICMIADSHKNKFDISSVFV
jgi:hypothetical protein